MSAKLLTLTVAKRESVSARALDAFSGKRRGAHISFASADLLWEVLTAKRWELLKAMTGGGAMTLREAARRVDRDVKAVHGDVHALLTAGVLRRNEDGKIEFPFDAVHVDFMLKARRGAHLFTRSFRNTALTRLARCVISRASSPSNLRRFSWQITHAVPSHALSSCTGMSSSSAMGDIGCKYE